MDIKEKNNSIEMGKRINETKREIAQLNEELETLINSNFNKHNSIDKDQKTNLGKIGPIPPIVKRIDNSIKAPNMVSNVNLKYSNRRNMTPINFSTNMDNIETLCKRNKSYNKESAKAYMRQQREKREEERKKLSSKSKIDQEIRKQKLLELQQKSLALVHRNIKLSQERSKSRDNRQPIRIDKSVCSNKTTKIQNKEAGNHDSNTPRVKNASRLRFQNDISKNNQIKPDTRKYNMQNVPEVKLKTSSNECVIKDDSKQDQSHLEVQPSVSHKNITFCADNMDCLPYADKDLAATKIQAFYRGYQLRKKIKSKSTDFTRLQNYSKETQTNVQEQQIITPVWLQTPSIDPYPCNFINTVKRKLQFVVNSVNSRDVGTQSSIIGSCSHEPYKFYNKNEGNHQIDVKTRIEDRLISFNSHRYSNLDAGALQHMVLVHKESKTGHNSKRSTESESDTSKNITDLTSEVVLIPNHTVEAVPVSLEQSKNLAINTDKIRDLHLTDPSKRNIANSHTFTKVLRDSVDIDQSISKKSYTFNFYDDQNSDVDYCAEESDKQKYVKSPRDSILSFNKCYYKNESNDKILINSSLGSSQSGECVKECSRSSVRRPISSKNICSDRHPSNSNIARESNMCETSDILDIIENIENSINTSLISHISDNKSDTSCATSNKSKKSTTISISENSVSKNYTSSVETANALLKPTLSQINLPNNMHIENKNSSSILMPINSSGLLALKKSINSNYEEKKQTAAEPSQVITCSSKQLSSNIRAKNLKPNKIIEKTSISTEYSHLEKQVSQQKNLSGQSEVTSSYASSFCSENTNSAEENKIVKSKETPKSELNNMDLGNDIVNNLDNEIDTNNIVKNINTKICQTKGDMNEIHLKFEAEVHLLNDFNESLKQFMAVEKAFETIKNKNEECCASVRDRNSSICNGPNYSEKSNISMNISKGTFSSVNLCRGSEINDSFLSNDSLMRTAWKSLDNSLDFEISNIDENIEKSSITIPEKFPNNLTGLSIKMFEQLIKDEDVRIENLKTILKIREQALLDRTKGELAWLEIQRKHLKETGRVHEASLVKKKQRGILLKHQQERREMQRLKQLQKMQSNERKTILKEQRNLIKAKLISEKVMSDMKIHAPRKRQSNGPMKVLKSSGSIHSETSLTKKTSDYEEILSITSKSQSIRLSEVDSSRDLVVNTDETNIRMVGSQNNLSNMKKALLMRQTALMERRKAVEDLLYRHQKLLEEEKKIEELEMAANAIIMQIPTINQLKSIDGSKLKLRDKNLKENSHKTELSEKSRVDNSMHLLQSSQNQLHDETTNNKHDYQAQCKGSPSTNSIDRASEINANTSYSNIMITDNKKLDHCNDSVSKKSFEYSEDFEINTEDTVNDLSLLPDTNENNLSSISDLIQDFSQIEQGISMLSKKFEPAQCSVASHNSYSDIESNNEFDQSVIETNKMQHFNNKTVENNLSFPIETMQCNDTNKKNESSQKFYSLLESSEKDNLSDSENMVSSISTIADPLTSIKEGTTNSSKITNNKFIVDVIPSTGVLSQHSRSEVIPSLLSNGASVTYSENTGKPSQFDNHISHYKTSAIEPVTAEVEDRIPSDNLTTHEDLQKYETVHESSIIHTLSEDPTKSKVCDEIVTEEPNSIHSIASTSMEGIQNENISVCEKQVIHNPTESESNENIYEGIDISLQNTYSNKPFEAHSLKLEQSNSDLKQEEKSNTINSICETPQLELYKEQQNDIKEITLSENISSEQTINEDIPDLNNSQLCYADNQISNVNSLNSCNKENKCTSNTTTENRSDKSYSGIVKLFENELCKTNSNTTDISEKLSTDSEHLDISELSPSDNSDNYTDDFEDDKELDSLSVKDTKNDTNVSSSQSESEMKNKKSIHNKGNEVLMMKIDLTSEEFNNQASIVVMSDNKAYFEENVSNNDKNTDVCISGKELSCVLDDKNISYIEDKVVTEQILTKRRDEEHFEIMKPEDIPVNMTIQLSEDFTIDSPKSIQDKDIHHQDHYVTTYEDITPVNSPEAVSPIKSSSLPSMNIFGSEAEELLKKQIAIEQEIKHLEQQQKEHLPFVYMREIPNKPPPPYTPPSSLNNQTSTILPSKVEDLTEICNYSAKVLYNAYLSNKLNDVTFSETDFKSINQTKSTKECCLFVFDLCREVVKNHYKKFEKDNVPYWLKASRDSNVILGKPFDYYQLEKHINAEVKHLLGFEKKYIRENSVIRWSKKKKDHVDEILALESQFEENEWLDYEKDELMVKNEITNEIFNVLLEETVDIYKKIFS
ncbi:hypothetical protein WA026_012863 [Henosepilachna vigintioctopunctata]|uniref:Centrosome-associated protein 350 n=1 Tax=Henosepilachna vigintioctopunctata TaxID=420089 RepID=A0AAW1TTK3_9CUCU